jgi:hypothetical protein
LIYFNELLYAEQLRRDNRSPEVRFSMAKGISALADRLDRNHKLWTSFGRMAEMGKLPNALSR